MIVKVWHANNVSLQIINQILTFRKVHCGVFAGAFLWPDQRFSHGGRTWHPNTRSDLAQGTGHWIYQSGKDCSSILHDFYYWFSLIQLLLYIIYLKQSSYHRIFKGKIAFIDLTSISTEHLHTPKQYVVVCPFRDICNLPMYTEEKKNKHSHLTVEPNMLSPGMDCFHSFRGRQQFSVLMYFTRKNKWTFGEWELFCFLC